LRVLKIVWPEGSEAQRWMKIDIAAKTHIGKTPTQFRMLRAEYQLYSIAVIRGKIQQEERLIKILKQYRAKKGH